MFIRRLLYFILIASGLFAEDTISVILRQGLNGYLGCEDGYAQIIMDKSGVPAVMDSALTDSNYAGTPYLYAQAAS